MDREWDSTLTVVLDEVWTRYDGDQAYFDHRTGDGSIGFEPGIGKIDPWTTDPTAANSQYYHADLIGTTRFMTDAAGNQVDGAVSTAFGERVSGTMADLGDRYGYAGAWGYQAHEEFPFLHVGHRYYDPATGRFLQRDPIGVVMGFNVYSYVGGNPYGAVDPMGLYPWGSEWDLGKCEGYCGKQGVKSGAGPSAKKGGAIGCAVGTERCVVNCQMAEDDVENTPYVPYPPDWDPWGGPSTDVGKPPSPPPPPPGGGGCGGGGGGGAGAAGGLLWPLLVLHRRRRRTMAHK